MQDIEEEFVRQALTIGLAGKIAALSAEVTQTIETFPAIAGRRYLARLQDQRQALAKRFPAIAGRRYLARLQDQRQALAKPSLRMVAAMVRTLCLDDPLKAPIIAEAFDALAIKHPPLSCFNATVQDLVGTADARHQRRA